MLTKDKIALLFAFLLVLLTAACSGQDSAVNIVKFQPSDYQVILYSNNTNLDIEEEYVDAILSLKNKYADKIKGLKMEKTTIYSIENASVKIDEFPTLVIKKKGKVIANISGQKKKNEILNLIQKSIQTKINPANAN